jgi:hypothetical protein
MPVGMKVCGFKVLSAVSVAVRHSLTGDRNDLRAQFTDPGSKGRVLFPLVLSTTRFLVNVFGSVRFHSEFRVMKHGFWEPPT